MGAAWTASVPAIHYAGLLVVAATPPSLEAVVQENLGSQSPVLNGTSTTGQTGPPPRRRSPTGPDSRTSWSHEEGPHGADPVHPRQGRSRRHRPAGRRSAPQNTAPGTWVSSGSGADPH